MIQEALEFLTNLQTKKNPQHVVVDGQPYKVNHDGTLGEPVRKVDPRLPRPTLKVSTLSGLVTAYGSGIDHLGTKTALVVNDPFSVSLVDLDADEYGKRHVYVQAIHVEESPFRFNSYMDPEAFILAFRASFDYNENAVQLQKACSTLTAGTGVAVADDGVSQKVTTESGTIQRGNATLPAEGISLIPRRTFRDANPVEATFLLRMKPVKDSLPQIALFEIDAMWKLYAMASIRKYLEDKIPGSTIIG